MTIRFRHPIHQVAVAIASSVVERFSAHRQKFLREEAGGQLFGAFKDSSTVAILKATGPRRSDKRGRFFYTPDKGAEQWEINEAFKAGLHYVGDWHTHPQKIPSPSGQDVANLQNVFSKSSHSLNYLLLAVVGKADFPQGIYLGLVDTRGVHPMSLVLEEHAIRLRSRNGWG